MAQIAVEAFHGPAGIVLQLMFLGLGSWAAQIVVRLIGRPTLAEFIRLATDFAGVCLVAKLLWDTVVSIGRLLGFA